MNKYYSKAFLIFILLSFLPVDFWAKAGMKQNNSSQISYYIEPFYDLNLMRLIIVLEFTGDKSGETKIILPSEYGGQNNIDGIKFLKTLSPQTTIEDTDRPEVKKIKHPANARLKIYYQVEDIRDDDIELGNHYMPVIQKQYFHFLGETVFVIPQWDYNREYNFKITWDHFPSNWNLANSFGVNEKVQEVKLPLWKFRFSVHTGGDFKIVKKKINDKPLYFAVRGKWQFNLEQFCDIASNIIYEERRFWNDFDFPYFLITVLPMDGGNDQGGTGRVNSFALFLSDDRNIDFRLKRLIAHEMFHSWIGEKIIFSQPEELCYWFKEGFTDYYARLTLLRSGIIALDEYVEDYNRVLKQYFTSSARTEKNEVLINDFWKNNDIMKLPYQRGDIIAHNLNAAIVKNSNSQKSLDDFMLDIYKRSREEKLEVSNGSLSALIRHYAGESTLSEIMSVLNSAAVMKTAPEALGPCYSMNIDTYNRFWLLGETYSVPNYFPINKDSRNNPGCMDWFKMR